MSHVGSYQGFLGGSLGRTCRNRVGLPGIGSGRTHSLSGMFCTDAPFALLCIYVSVGLNIPADAVLISLQRVSI